MNLIEINNTIILRKYPSIKLKYIVSMLPKISKLLDLVKEKCTNIFNAELSPNVSYER